MAGGGSSGGAPLPIYATFAASATAASFAEVTTLPLDTAKVRPPVGALRRRAGPGRARATSVALLLWCIDVCVCVCVCVVVVVGCA